MDMSRHQDDNLKPKKDWVQDSRWVIVERDVVAKLEGTIDAPKVTALIVYGDITSDRLRSINVGKLATLSLRGGSIEGHVPNPDEVSQGFDDALKLYEFRRGADGLAEVVSKVWPAEDVLGYVRQCMATARQEAESDQEVYFWYFGTTMSTITPHVESAHKTMGEALDLKPNTIKSYVQQCRKFGFLPPARRSTK